MTNTDGIAQRAKRPAYGPHAVFAAAALMAFLVLTMLGQPLPDVALPLVVTLLFGLAVIASIFAWKSAQRRTSIQLNYWDVAGALVLIGVGFSVLIEPEHLASVLESQNRRP